MGLVERCWACLMLARGLEVGLQVGVEVMLTRSACLSSARGPRKWERQLPCLFDII